MRNITEERQRHLYSKACPLFRLLSFPCFLFPMFISRSFHLYSYISSSVAGGWLGLTFMVPVSVCVCVCLCICQHSVYFQSILFKDQTRGWWLIFLSLALSFISLGNEGGEERNRGGVRHLHKPGSNVHIPPKPSLITLLLSTRGVTTLLKSPAETDLAYLTIALWPLARC